MSKDISAAVNQHPESPDLWVYCAQCEAKTNHLVLSEVNYEEHFDDFPQGYEVIIWEDYQVIQCQGCQSLSFRKVHRDTESEELDPAGNAISFAEQIDLYPPRLEGRKQLRKAINLPHNVYKIYNETRKALSNDLSVLAGIGVRALLETVCKEQSANGNNLAKKIDDLVNQGVLTENGAEFLHSLRLMGNASAHEVKPHDDQVLETAFDVIEHLLNTVYLIPERAASSNLPKRTRST